MAVSRERPPRIAPEAARRELVDELLGPPSQPYLPELYAGEAQTTFDIAPPEAPTSLETVGVVFVHGVGSQKKGDTLREFGTPLVDWVEEWHRSRGMVSKITWAELSHPSEPASAALLLPECPDPDRPGKVFGQQRWMLAEAWWAPRVAEPEYNTMLAWAWKRLPWLIEGLWEGALDAATVPVYFRRDTWPARIEQLGQLLNAIAVSVLYSIAQLLLTLVLFVLAAIARVPLLGLEEFVLVKLVRPLLLENVGDFYVFVYDRIQATHIRQSIYETVNWLVRSVGCSRVLVAAHSGGTVVAVDALGTPDLAEPGQPPLPRPMEKVDTLITFGAALNRAWDESYASDEDKPSRVIPEYLHPPAKWRNFWTSFDWAHPGRGLDHGQAAAGTAGDTLVVNGLSPLSDHGGYLRNFEQFIAALAMTIEGTPTRFALGQADRDRSRRGRVGILTLWRALAVGMGAAVIWSRYVGGSRDLAADGRALWDAVAGIPALGGIIAAIGSGASLLVEALRNVPRDPSSLVDPLLLGGVIALGLAWRFGKAKRFASSTALLTVGVVGSLFVLRDPALSEEARLIGWRLTAIAAVLLVAGLSYWTYVALLFSGWDRKVSLLSARAQKDAPVVTLQPTPTWAPNVVASLTLRTIGLALITILVAWQLATAPAFADLALPFAAVAGR